MTEWASPWALWLLVPVLLLPLQARWTGRNRLAVPSLDAVEAGWTLRRLLAWVPDVLRVVGLALVVIALGRPQLTERSLLVEQDGLDILLAVDVSGSMDARDFTAGMTPVSRMDVAKAVMSEFVEDRPHDRIGVVVFGAEAFTYVPLTLDHDTLQRGMEQIQIGLAGRNATAIGGALAVGGRRLKQVESKERVFVLLTDGRNNVERPDPIQASNALAALGIRVYTIGIGGRSIGYGSDTIDEPMLREIAELTGGQYFRATTTAALFDVYEAIDELETSTAEVSELVHSEELYRRWLVPGVVLLLLQLLLSSTWLRRGP